MIKTPEELKAEVTRELNDAAEMEQHKQDERDLGATLAGEVADEIGSPTAGIMRAIEARDEQLTDAVAKRMHAAETDFMAKAIKRDMKKERLSPEAIREKERQYRQSRREIAPMTARDLSEVMRLSNPTMEEYRIIVDNFYQNQLSRLRVGNQIDAMLRGVDGVSDRASLGYETLVCTFTLNYGNELELGKVLGVMAERTPVGVWCMSNKGIGPALTCTLLGRLDFSRAPHVGNFISFCGLNDNNRPKITAAQADKIIAEISLGSPTMSLEQVMKVCELTQWKMDVFNHVNDKGNSAANYKTVRGERIIVDYDTASVRKLIVRPPYSKYMKTVMWKIGHQFQLLMNRDCLYGSTIRDRRIYESAKNEALEYADQARHILETKNFRDKNSPTYKSLCEGKLSQAHIIQRCNRVATKLFISHLHGEYMYAAGLEPERPWILAHGGHSDYIPPEVPYIR